MTLALGLYRGVTSCLTPFLPLIYKRRLAEGKELAGRLNERLARALPDRPDGPLIWLHGASLGESKLLIGLASELAKRRPGLNFVFTSQTVSSANMVAARLPLNARQQMAPIDTPHITARFAAHWQPQLCIFAEGEIWPNLIKANHARGARIALINARMTDRSLAGWKSISQTAQQIFSCFDLILAADLQTTEGLSALTDIAIIHTGNLKVPLAALSQAQARQGAPLGEPCFGKANRVVLGASTHAGEEDLLLQALSLMPDDTRLILAPRHPGRADDIETLILATGRPYARRSRAEPITTDTRILLADTFGEMDVWYRAAHSVYLGGGHKRGIGGHSPLEPLSFGLPIVTGPHTSNFADTHKDLEARQWVHTASTPESVGVLLMEAVPPPPEDIALYFKTANTALNDTVDVLLTLLPEKVSR